MLMLSAYRFSGSDPIDDGTSGGRKPPLDYAQSEDLPFKVELWDPSKSTVELVLATTASGTIGFAAYHAATTEFPDRYIVLRHHNTVLSRWNGPKH